MSVEREFARTAKLDFPPLFLKFQIELSHRSFCPNLSTRQADEGRFFGESQIEHSHLLKL